MPNPASRRLGILGGTFDPPHLGHLAAAEAVRTQLGLDQVLFLVANDPWQKSDARAVTPADVRLKMVHSLIDGRPGLGVDDREIRRGGLTYTADTLEEIHAESPSTDVFLIVGADTASRMHTWHRPDVVARLSTLVVVNRNDGTNPNMRLNAIGVAMEPVDVSSTLIRTRVAAGESIAGLTTDGVADIITQHRLYEGIR